MKLFNLFLALLFISCNNAQFGKITAEDGAITKQPTDLVTPPSSEQPGTPTNPTTQNPTHTISEVPRAICDPFREENNNPSPTLNYGIHGVLYDGINIQNPDHKKNFQGYLEHGEKINADVFMSRFYTPTRSFENGFSVGKDDTGADILIKNSNGEDLIEYFGIRFDGRLTLSDEDEEGYYEIATISDDGSVFKVFPDASSSQAEDIVDNDTVTSTKMTCTNKIIRFEKNSKIKYELDYFQAPRVHIALVTIWRKVAELSQSANIIASKSTENDSLCNAAGNQRFFNNQKDTESTPTADFNELLTNRFVNWKVMKPENFLLPTDNDTNPCNDPNYNPMRQGCFVETIENTDNPVIELKAQSPTFIDYKTLIIKKNGVEIPAAQYQLNESKGEIILDSINSSDKVTADYCLYPAA